MCWKTTCDTQTSALASSTPASDEPFPTIHSTCVNPELCSRASSIIRGDTSIARTDAADRAITRVSRPTPQPISTASSPGSIERPAMSSSVARSRSPSAQKRSRSGAPYVSRLSTKKNASSSARSSQNSCAPATPGSLFKPRLAGAGPRGATYHGDRVSQLFAADRPDVRSIPPWHRLAYIGRALPAAIEHLARDLPRPARVLDYGCADRPYRRLFPADADYVAADLPGNPEATVSIAPDGTVPVEDRSCDVVVSTQVLE